LKKNSAVPNSPAKAEASGATENTTSPCRFSDHKNPALRFSALLNEENPELKIALI
jgi:hypothetical protein